jgi:hypothetical protein
MFGGSKLAVNSDILIPPAVYWDDDPTYSGGKTNRWRWNPVQVSRRLRPPLAIPRQKTISFLSAHVYWDDDPTYSGGKDNHGGPWADKKDIVFWRGIASGGRNRRDTWTGLHYVVRSQVGES